MIIAHSSATRTATLLGCAFFAGVAGLSLTRAQPAPAVTASLAPPAAIAADPLAQTLVPLFPNGIVATIGDRTITVDDVRREITPLLPKLQRDSRNPDEFKVRLNALQNSVIRDLIGRFLLIKEFHHPAEGDGAKHIPEEYIDNEFADRLKNQFGGDQAKLLAHLQSRGLSMADYRKTIEEEIIYHYMESQERKLTAEEKAKSAPREGQTHIRLIQLLRAAGESDAALLEKANALLARFRNGERFEDLARELSQDARRSRGGDWGWRSPGDLQPEYEERFKALKVGEVSAPLMIPEGCFLLYVEARR